MVDNRFFTTFCAIETNSGTDGSTGGSKNQTTSPQDALLELFSSKKGTIKDRINARRQLSGLLSIRTRRLHIDLNKMAPLDENQRQALLEEFQHLFLLLCTDVAANGFSKERGEQFNRCAQLIQILKPRTDKNVHDELIEHSNQSAKYVALRILAPWVADGMLDFQTAFTETLQSTINTTNEINGHRLNWIWSGGLVLAILDMLPAELGHCAHARQQLSASTFSDSTGYFSFVIYYFRLGLNLSLLAHGTLKGSWINDNSDTDQHIGMEERFRTQWQQRKFLIINDVFWSVANMVCFLYLYGPGLLGYIGNSSMAGLLLLDLGCTVYEYKEMCCDQEQLILKYNEDIEALKATIETKPDNVEVLKLHLKQLEADKKRCEFEWSYTHKNLMDNFAYVLFLSLTFGLVCCSLLYVPLGITAANALMINLVGSGLSAAATMASHAKETHTKLERTQALKEYEGENKAYHDKMYSHYQLELAQRIVSDAMIPATVFVLLVFAPTGLSLPILIPVVMLCLLSGFILEQWKPPEELPALDSSPQPS